MPELHFKGKEFVYNHHLTVPFRPLVPDTKKSCGSDNENLIIHGDNLHALKSLLPRYAGKVDLVFIDPPYNTGNEGWAYNDNVNSPMLKEWLDGNPVNGEDMLRHDKWLCMMWPRLKLLHELLSESGSIWITLDDNEIHHARSIMDEICGESSHLATVIWEKADSPKMDVEHFSSRHDSMLVYAKDPELVTFHRLRSQDENLPSHYDKVDENGRSYYLKPLRAMGSGDDTREARPTLYFDLTAPDGTCVLPKKPDGSDGRWRWGKKRFEENPDRIEWRKSDSGWAPYFRIYADLSGGRPPETIFYNTNVGSSRSAAAELKRLMGENVGFSTPKPTRLVELALQIGGAHNSLVLDSFAGSGTTAHAVLAQNAKDGGNRKFILVEGEDYADTLTAERMRRVIKGYAFTGTQREELLREKITLTQLKKASQLLDKVALVEQQNASRFDAIKSTVKDGELIVTGEKQVKKKTGGLGGGFTYCTLGEKLEIDDLLTGKSLPSFEAFGGYLFHTATGQTLEPAKIREGEGYLGESAQYHVWLVYKPELNYLKSRDASLTLSLAERIAATDRKKHHLVFAPARFVPQKTLLELGVEHAPLPYALYRIEKA